MMKTGIAGGIGSGKSYVCQLLRKRGYEVYDCDDAAKRLIRTSPEIREQLTHLVGPQAYTSDGQLNKAVISQFLLASADNQKAINDIVHPAVFRDFEESKMEWMESAIMYESGIYKLVDRVVVVTAPLETRIRRVMRRDHISRKKVLEWIEKQLPQEEVVRRADFELINDGKADLEQQLNKIIEQCNRPF
jgi:dephospho-CoA kinase